VSLFGGRGGDSLTAFANEQIKAMADTAKGSATSAGGARGAGGAGGAGDAGWTSLAAVAVQLFTAVRRASTLGDLVPVQDRIAPDLRAALIRQQETMAAGGRRRVTRIDQVSAEAFNGQVPGPADRVMVVRYKVAGGLGEGVLGDDLDAQLAVLPSRTWVEIWRLSRPPDAPALEPVGTCPSCGAPSNGLVTCHYCGTSLLTTPSDFAVASIEWLA
jgi:hypothetical protein